MTTTTATSGKQLFRSFHTESSNEENARLLTADPKTVDYELIYFKISCLAATARHLFAFGKINWKNSFPTDWDEEKYDSPFGLTPLLHIRSQGKELTLTESIVIDFYLAKKFDLLGSNEYEEHVIKAFYSSIHALRDRSLRCMTWTYADKRKEAFETWTTENIPRWIKIKEQHLERNGSNGHFFGEKLSLADIHLVSVIDHFAELPRGEEIVALFRASPLLWKVHETVLANPDIAAWRESDEFKEIVKGGKIVYAKSRF